MVMHIYMRIKRKNSYGNWLISVHPSNAIHTLKRGLVTGHCWRTAKKCAAAGDYCCTVDLSIAQL